MNTISKISIPQKSQPYNFDYFLVHYVFAPWIVENPSFAEATKGKKELVRLFKLGSGKFVLVKVGFRHSSTHLGGVHPATIRGGSIDIKEPKPTLIITFQSKSILTKTETDDLKKLISWIYAVDEEVRYFYEVICQKDPVLKAASKEIFGAHLRTDPYVFESVIGVIIAQNVLFKRIYEMQRLLCEKFGEKQKFDNKVYYTFPTPQRLAKASLEEIRSCKVGYRDKYIKGVAEKIVKENINLDDLRTIKDIDTIRNKLIELPGVGPYTANLAMAIGFRLPTFHLDLFTREALWQFYFKGKKVSDEKLKKFADDRWGKWKHHAMLLLTTNTDVWAKEAGLKFRLKSGAKNN